MGGSILKKSTLILEILNPNKADPARGKVLVGSARKPGIGTEVKSFDYLALYDADYKRIMENLQAIADAAKLILKWLDAP